MEHEAVGRAGARESDGEGIGDGHRGDEAICGAVAAWSDVAGVVFTIGCAALVLLPVLRPGVSLGPFDLLSRFGLTRQSGVTVHNAIQGDQIQQFVPWTDLAWHQIRSGHVPLWNPYNVLGTPFAFNWQTGIFSLPMLVSYLVPVHLAYAIVVLAKLVIAGTGAYTLCRVLGLGPLSSALGGTTFELSGPIIVHSGWSMTGVTCWAGWVFAAIVLLLGGRHRLRDAALLAVVVAFAVYGGHPESLIVLTLTTVVFVLVYVGRGAHTKRDIAWRRLLDVVAGCVGGLGLAAPLLFPGVQLGASSARSNVSGAPAFSLAHVPNVLTGGLQGLDFRNSAYVGVFVIALALAGAKVFWHRPEVKALVAVAIVCTILTFFGPADLLLGLLPGAHTVAWSRSVMILPLALAVLAALGAQALIASHHSDTVVRWMTWALVAEGFVVVVAGLAAQLGISAVAARHEATLIWPAAEVALGLGAMAAVRKREVIARRVAWAAQLGFSPGVIGRRIVAIVLVFNGAFLIFSGVSFWSESSGYFAPTAAVETLQGDVGTGLVGYGSCRHIAALTDSLVEVGIKPDVNIAFGVREMVVYDPIIPDSYFRAWRLISRQTIPRGQRGLGIFCASINSVAQAQVLGVNYILEPPGKPGPTGTRIVGQVGTETLYLVSDTGQATLSPIGSDAGSVEQQAVGTPVAVAHPNMETWRLTTTGTTRQVLRLRLTNVPGWNATIDGRPLALRPWADGLMLEADVPAGSHTVELTYLPGAYRVGIVVAIVVVLVFLAMASAALVQARSRRRTSVP